MNRILRTPLAAGAVAVVAAAGLPTAPADSASRMNAALAAPSSAQFALTAWQNPIIALLDSGEMGENYVFGGYYNGADAPTPGAGEANWPFAGFDQTGGDTLNYLLTRKAELGNYFDVGFLPNFTAGAYLPAVQQWLLNVEEYISVVLSGLNGAARDLAMGEWAEAGQGIVDTATYVLANFWARAEALVAVVPQILQTFAGTAIGGATFLAAKTAAIVNEVVASLSNGSFEGAWNAAVDGTLGPSGIPGALFNLITGAGVQIGPILTEADIPANFVPSFRTSVQAAQWTVRGALETTVVQETAAAQAVPAAAALGDAPKAVAIPESLAAVADPVGAESVSDKALAAPAETAKDAAPKRKAAKRDRSHRAVTRAGNGS
jgi:hypothetical protein